MWNVKIPFKRENTPVLKNADYESLLTTWFRKLNVVGIVIFLKSDFLVQFKLKFHK